MVLRVVGPGPVGFIGWLGLHCHLDVALTLSYGDIACFVLMLFETP